MESEVRDMHETCVALIWELLQPETNDVRRRITRQAVADLILAHTGEDIADHKLEDVDPAALRQLLSPKQSAAIAVILRRLQGISSWSRETGVI